MTIMLTEMSYSENDFHKTNWQFEIVGNIGVSMAYFYGIFM